MITASPTPADRFRTPGGLLLGTMVMYVRAPGIIRMISQTGFDYVFVDMQHSSLGWETIADMCEVGRACGLAVIVRPSTVSQAQVNRIQDLGAHGIMFPDVRSREEIDRFLHWMHYPPSGERGVTVGGPSSDYRVDRGPEALERLNRANIVVVQAECMEAVDALPSMLSGGGIDLVEVGRQDLSASLGVPGETSHPKVLDALRRVVADCDAHGVRVGAQAANNDDAQRLLDLGLRCISHIPDRRILLLNFEGAIRDLRGLERSVGVERTGSPLDDTRDL